MTTHKWQFTPRFRHHAFGWRSDKPIQRIKEALSEIKQAAKKEPGLAATGAVLFLEKLSPALEQVDSSSGAIGTMVNHAIDTLVPIIAKAPVEPKIRQQWMERLWTALQDDQMPYIELLGDYWGELCASPACASRWADEFLPIVKQISESSGYAFFKGTSAFFSSLNAAGRHEELLAILEKPYFKSWWYRQWGVRALLAMDKKTEALCYAEDSRKIINTPASQIAKVCEEILLSSGFSEEAYSHYAIEANQGTTHLATFRALAKKYPQKPAVDILNDLLASQPGSEGKWFAAAKDAGLFDVAIELVNKSPTDPRTLIRAARDYAEKKPDFAVSAGIAALYWLSRGYGYQITTTDIMEAYSAILIAAHFAGIAEALIKSQISGVVTSQSQNNGFVLATLNAHLMN
ncbi:MAG: hypothetical protein ABL903_09080 [Methylococcales bacterium]